MAENRKPSDLITFARSLVGFVGIVMATAFACGLAASMVGCKSPTSTVSSASAKQAAADHLATSAARRAPSNVFAADERFEVEDWKDFVYAPPASTVPDPRQQSATPPATVDNSCAPGTACYRAKQAAAPRPGLFRRVFRGGG